MSIVLGIDPGSYCTGYGVIEYNSRKTIYRGSGVIKAVRKDNFFMRLGSILNGFLEVLNIYNPQILSIEEAFVGCNVASALKLAHVRGIILAQAIKHSMDIYEYAPRKIKRAITGQGNSSKDLVRDRVVHLLNLGALPKFDASDALAISLTYIYENLKTL